ncbi:biotin-dependent carboxyltransferase family protein [Devosia sp. YIM 151766]|uniref:5-oxoprolinase subunit C family protein n=1 Tax=Devosia sp. YIM 151766 TaxID=3017325 RepID=UPI00255CF85F|nr:biotin-dependent carboxyltransferase family protein [Devosia sp. YIM 151766]WIY54265.1 biotin-dependent carboxyltransferase family protein [Devosia sp. YIM 151766]
MSALIRIKRAGPLTTIQDEGRHGMLAHGVSASGPMDRAAYRRAGLLAGATHRAGVEFTQAGLDLVLAEGELRIGWDGGAFVVRINGREASWPGSALLAAGDRLSVTPGASGNYGYLRFGGALDLDPVLGSHATNMRARLGGLDGRALVAGDELAFSGVGTLPEEVRRPDAEDGPIRFIRGLHWSWFSPKVQEDFVKGGFRITPIMDRMGVRLADEGRVFGGESILSLVSDPVQPGDIQILGDGTPIVLMRDHQPTGGYPRIGTVIGADLDRFAQMRPGEVVAFAPMSVERAHRMLRSGRA